MIRVLPDPFFASASALLRAKSDCSPPRPAAVFASAVGRQVFTLSLCPCRRAFSGAAQTFSCIIIHETKAKEKRKKCFFPREPILRDPPSADRFVFAGWPSFRVRWCAAPSPTAPRCPLRHCGRFLSATPFFAASRPFLCCFPAVSPSSLPPLFRSLYCRFYHYFLCLFSAAFSASLPPLSLPLCHRAISFARPLFFSFPPSFTCLLRPLPPFFCPTFPFLDRRIKKRPATVATAAGAYTVQSGLISGRRSGEDQVFFGDGQMGVGSSVRHSR